MSPWPHPSFIGTALPETRRVSSGGFVAHWRVTDFGRAYPSHWTSMDTSQLAQQAAASTFGVSLMQPVDIYQQAERAVKYAILFLVLTFLVFFNSSVWLMAATVSRRRLWLALVFLALIAAAFVVTVTIDRFRPAIDRPEPPGGRGAQLADTPFAAMPDPPQTQAFNRAERLNVLFVLVISQLAHILVVAVVTAMIFLILGLIILSPELLAAWTRNGSSDGTFLVVELAVTTTFSAVCVPLLVTVTV